MLDMGYQKINWWLKWQLFYLTFSCWKLVYGQIRYSIPEELQSGAFVGNIAHDLGLDVKRLSARSFRIVSGPRKQYLDVNLENGSLFVKEKIDREELCGKSPSCRLSSDAVVETPPNVYPIEVEVLDVNDNAPVFPKRQFSLEISELVAPGTRFTLERAQDPDVGINSIQTYELVANEYFSLNIQTRSVGGKSPELVLEKPLDREIYSNHQLVLIAKDGGIPERSGTTEISVIVEDANDNSPIYSESVYRVSLSENTPRGTLVIQLNATDLDEGYNGEIVFSFSGHTTDRVSELFSLDSKSGEIRVQGNLDFEVNDVFEINVQAKDKGPYAIPVYCEVLVNIVDANDNPPEVTLTSLFSPVGEDALPGTVVAVISAADRDSGANGQIQCQLANKLPFKLDSSLKNYYRLVTQEPLDRENASVYDITIVCSDRGSPPLTANKHIRVEVSDINDNAPQFGQPLYTAHVMENNPVGSSIYSVTAYDPDSNQNSRLSYSILESQVEGESVSGYVSINSDTGVIFSQRSFDYEQLKQFQILVQAQDNGVPALSTNVSVHVTILDQNDNSPVIVSPLAEFGSTVTETVSRLAESGYLVAKITATDDDSGQNARLSYHLLQATDPGLFTISSGTGDIWTIRSVQDRDVRKQRLVILVKDNGIPSLSATMTIILSVVGRDTEMLSDSKDLSVPHQFDSPFSLYLVISLAIISSIFLVVLIILIIKIHRQRSGFHDPGCSLCACCCFYPRHSLNGIQKASRNLQIPPNYVEVFGGDPLSQSFRYGSYSTSGSSKGGFPFSNTHSSYTQRNKASSEPIGNEVNQLRPNSVNYRNSVTHEVRGF